MTRNVRGPRRRAGAYRRARPPGARLLWLAVPILAGGGLVGQEPDAGATVPGRDGYAIAEDGTRLFYRAIGEGSEAVLIPVGFYLERFLARLARPDRRLVFYDPRGRGRSDAVDTTRVSLDHQLSDVEAVRRELGIERMTLIGWSGLGMEMAVYALRHPGRVARLVQVAPVPPSFAPYSEGAYAERARRYGAAAEELRRRVERDEFRGDPAGHCRAVNAITLPAMVADSSRIDEVPDVCRFENERPDNLGPLFRALLGSFGDYDWRDELRGLEIPRLVIHGDLDAFPVAGSRDWVRGYPNARLVVLEDADHFPFLDRPEAFFDLVNRFLDGEWPGGVERVAGRTPGSGWPTYGGDPGGSRYSSLDLIHRGNVAQLELAWSYRTGELGQDARDGDDLTFEATAILFEGTLYLSTGFGKVIALESATGEERWSHDPGVDRSRSYSELTSRGVTAWRDPAAPAGAPCAARIFLATIDARLVALDAAAGTPCADFGERGQVHLAREVGMEGNGDYQVTSPPAVVNGVLVVGSSIGDNWSVDTGSGVVRGFDARTGEVRWRWHPIPRGAEQEGRVGAANAWSVFSVDAGRDLVFIPTSSPSPDFYGGLRPADNRWANSVVALRASTGELVWGFQTVHHDLWDYDVAAQPVLVEVERDGDDLPAVAVATKRGALFLLHRETGEPLFEIEERPAPRSDVPGEEAWPTQPWPVKPRPLVPQGLAPEDLDALPSVDRAECVAAIEGARSEGPFTPPSLEGTVLFPGNAGGTNWGSAAWDPERGLLVLNTLRLPTYVQLIQREELNAARRRPDAREHEFGSQRGAPFGMRRRSLRSSRGVPCSPLPWGTLVAVELATGELAWEVPFGASPLGPETGQLNMGGPIVTAGGLVFIGASLDGRFRAFDLETGEELWSVELQRAAIATPMTYEADGRQFVVVAAGGHGKAGLPLGDWVLAFALPER